MATSSILNYDGQPFTFAHAADRSGRRGPQFAVRNDDIDRLIPSGDRRTLSSLSNRLYMNMGIPKACVNQKADYAVGEAWLPSYINAADTDAGKPVSTFLREVWMPQCDTRGGVFDWHNLLYLTSIAIDRDGDVFWILVKGADNFPRIQMVPGHRCYSSGISTTVQETGSPWNGYRINDGVIYYASGRPAAYRFNTGKDGKEVFTDIPASDVIHMFDPTHCEQGRGLPAFTHALESLKMSLLSTEDERIRQQIVSRLHLTVFNTNGAPDLDDPLTVLGNDGNGIADFTSQLFPGGVKYMVEGEGRIEQMEHKNPGVVWDAFQDRLARDAIIPVWSYSVWKSTGQGTAERGEVVKCRRFVTKRQSTLWYAAKRATTWAYSVFAANGRVPQLRNPSAWSFSYPPRLSVDDGRESKMEMNELVTGSRNLSEVLEARGIVEDEFLRARAWSVANRKAIARIVAEEASAKYGVDVTIEDREMFMQTPNEMGATEEPDAPEPPAQQPTPEDPEDD
jgi:hypothetical protein